MVLAEAGLLDGEVATTHWSAVDLIRRRYPRVRLEPQRILTASGHGGRILTAGGASAWEELALCLIARGLFDDRLARNEFGQALLFSLIIIGATTLLTLGLTRVHQAMQREEVAP